jgi:hypothetical protein
MCRLTAFLTGVTFVLLAGCGEEVATNVAVSNATSATSTTVATSASVLVKPSESSSKAIAPFTASVNDVISQVNLQLSMLVDGGAATKLPVTVLKNGVFGGPVTRSVDIYLLSSSNAFSPVRAITLRVRSAGGPVQTPTRLLSGIGASLYALSRDAVESFRNDALPRLSVITQSRTTITVGTFYDLTVVVFDQSKLAFVFTPVGVTPPSGAETIGE